MVGGSFGRGRRDPDQPLPAAESRHGRRQLRPRDRRRAQPATLPPGRHGVRENRKEEQSGPFYWHNFVLTWDDGDMEEQPFNAAQRARDLNDAGAASSCITKRTTNRCSAGPASECAKKEHWQGLIRVPHRPRTVVFRGGISWSGRIAPGLEPGASCTQNRRATRLRHAPRRSGAHATFARCRRAPRLTGVCRVRQRTGFAGMPQGGFANGEQRPSAWVTMPAK